MSDEQGLSPEFDPDILRRSSGSITSDLPPRGFRPDDGVARRTEGAWVPNAAGPGTSAGRIRVLAGDVRVGRWNSRHSISKYFPFSRRRVAHFSDNCRDGKLASIGPVPTSHPGMDDVLGDLGEVSGSDAEPAAWWRGRREISQFDVDRFRRAA